MIERYSLPEMSAVWKDEFKFRTMLEIELLAAEAFARQGSIPSAAAARMRRKACFDLEEIKKIEESTNHDIVAFVTNVSASIGADAQYFHAGLTSSDLLDTTLGVQLKFASAILSRGLEKLLVSIKRRALQHKRTVCIGRTHGVHAEPVTFGLKLAVWYEETKRNIARLKPASKEAAQGKLSGAVGTYSNIDPGVELFVCRKLGLSPASISTQIIQRDVYANYLCVLALIGSSLEKFAMEIRHLQKTEVLEAEEPFGKGQKGSSAMPHKRNPVICERICGLSRLLRGNAQVALENISLWHERDISHSSNERVIIPDSTIVLDYMLNKFTAVVDGLNVYPARMLENLERTGGLIFSQRVLLELMEKELPRPKAYDMVQRCAMRTWKGEGKFLANLMDDKEVSSYLSKKELERIFDLDHYLRNVDTIFKRTIEKKIS
ncbi:MAG: adenylosuccinate lyase [Candidatus Omnitrophota bacterium]